MWMSFSLSTAWHTNPIGGCCFDSGKSVEQIKHEYTIFDGVGLLFSMPRISNIALSLSCERNRPVLRLKLYDMTLSIYEGTPEPSPKLRGGKLTLAWAYTMHTTTLVSCTTLSLQTFHPTLEARHTCGITSTRQPSCQFMICTYLHCRIDIRTVPSRWRGWQDVQCSMREVKGSPTTLMCPGQGRWSQERSVGLHICSSRQLQASLAGHEGLACYSWLGWLLCIFCYHQPRVQPSADITERHYSSRCFATNLCFPCQHQSMLTQGLAIWWCGNPCLGRVSFDIARMRGPEDHVKPTSNSVLRIH